MLEYINSINNLITTPFTVFLTSMLLGYIPQSAAYIMFVSAVAKERFTLKQFVFS